VSIRDFRIASNIGLDVDVKTFPVNGSFGNLRNTTGKL